MFDKILLGSAAQQGTSGWDVSNATYSGTPLTTLNLFSKSSNPKGLFFKPDGTKMYITGSTADAVLEYNLSTAWVVGTASYVQTFSVATQEYSPSDLFFKDDGTKMYIVGISGDHVYQYNLSTAWDISTASYTQNFSVAGQEADPHGLFFKSDGTKMYVVGASADNVNEYSLSTAWDISTASYSQNFSVATQETAPTGMFFKGDGTKMYITGNTNDKVYEYNLSTAWDVSTASYSQDLYVGAEEIYPQAVVFKGDGTEMYVLGTREDTIFQYSLSTAWDISTASFSYPTTEYFSVAAQETKATGLFFKDDGSKMYVMGDSGNDVNEYSLSTDWDISTASYTQRFDVATQQIYPQSLSFKSDGTKMYIVGYWFQTNYSVHEYSLSTAWDISTASYNQNFSLSAQETNPRGLFFKPDGTKMYIIGFQGDDVNEYTLSTAWDISTASYTQNFSVATDTQENSPTGLFFKDDGTKMYILGYYQTTFNAHIYEYNLATAWDISTASYSHKFYSGAQVPFPTDLFIKPDGTKMYIIDAKSIWSYDL